MNGASNPYSVGIASVPVNDLDISNQFTKYKEEEKGHKAPQVLPFNFNAMDELVSILYKDLLAIRKVIMDAEKNSQVNKRYTAPILAVIDNIGNEILQSIPELLDKLEM